MEVTIPKIEHKTYMDIDVRGRVKNAPPFYSKPLMPVFEAIVNSIHSIEEAKIRNGHIDIIIERSEPQGNLLGDREIGNIKNFIIQDNGIGFNDQNFKSFRTSDSTFKEQKGGKGIGRFSWLKAFHSVHVESVFEKANEYYQRIFDFVLTPEGVTKDNVTKIGESKCITRVILQGFFKNYCDNCPKKPITIAQKILEHCLVYFLDTNSPKITVTDGEEKILLKDLFKELIENNASKLPFKIKEESFTITKLKLYGSEEQKHLVHFCAHNREVISENLSNYIPDLNKKLPDENGNMFIYSFYVSGQYLDKHVNAERMDFNINEDENNLFQELVSKKLLKEHTMEIIKKDIKEHLDLLYAEKIECFTDYVNNKAPQYRHLLTHPERLKNIPSNLTDENLDVQFYIADRDIDIEIKRTANSILDLDPSDISNNPEYQKQYNEFVKQVNESSKSKLINYIVHRKLILNLLDNRLHKTTQGKYELEKEIHNLIFPMGETSETVHYDKQNLWVIDERLSYHKFLASDKRLSSSNIAPSDERPDLLIFNEPYVLVDHDAPYQSIVIIEFKRPGRNEYSEEKDPIKQLYDYIEKLSLGNELDNIGRPIIVNANTMFYVYLICDLTPKIKSFAKLHDHTLSPDGLGYFKYHKEHKAYTEIISYDKMILDAKKRNKILFDKLHLPVW